jgi:hypothetical protein
MSDSRVPNTNDDELSSLDSIKVISAFSKVTVDPVNIIFDSDSVMLVKIESLIVNIELKLSIEVVW